MYDLTKLKFIILGDKMLVYSHSSIYEVKCLKRNRDSDDIPVYYIHYKGWKTRYDEWVYGNLLLDANETNLQKMMSLKKIKK